jgi:hypothetical protein
MKKIRSLSLLLVATLFVQNAGAMLLPYSSHYLGRSYFSDVNVTGFVDFAVYDTQGVNGNEWEGAGGFDSPGDGRYIYAYQVFNDVDSTAAIEFFKIMGMEELHHLVGIDTMDSQNPWENYPLITDGVEPTDSSFSIDETNATWEFAGGILIAGQYSWFLLFSSDNDWVKGQYIVQTEGGLPITGNPEPCTLALLGLGSAILLAKRKSLHS